MSSFETRRTELLATTVREQVQLMSKLKICMHRTYSRSRQQKLIAAQTVAAHCHSVKHAQPTVSAQNPRRVSGAQKASDLYGWKQVLSYVKRRNAVRSSLRVFPVLSRQLLDSSDKIPMAGKQREAARIQGYEPPSDVHDGSPATFGPRIVFVRARSAAVSILL